MADDVLMLPRGTRDLLAPEKILKDEVLSVIKESMEEFGFDPIETPALEMQSLFEAKLAHRQALDEFDVKERKLEDERAKLQDEIEEVRQYKTQKLADEIASENEVDSSLLLSMTDGTREKMEKLAKILPKKSEDDKPTFTPPPDSGKKSKVLTNPSLSQLEGMTMEQYADWVAERDKNKR